MKERLETLLDSLTPQELDELLPEDLPVSIPEDILARIEARVLGRTRTKHRHFLHWAAAAACLLLVLGAAAYTVEAKAYQTAADFFLDNGLSTEGLSREEVKAVYRDITTQRFTYDKTAEVLQRAVPGVEIIQKEPEELASLWNRNAWTAAPKNGFTVLEEYRLDETLGFDVFDRSFLQYFRDGELLWTAEFTDFYVEDTAPVSGGWAAWGFTPTWSSEQSEHARIACLDSAGEIQWERQLDHGFTREYVAAVLDNRDGTWAVISRGDFQYLCLSQYSREGEELAFHKTYVDRLSILNAVRLGDGYLVQLGSETARLAKLDREGNLTDSFTYEGEDCCYCLTNMLEYGERVYLSAYAVPIQCDEGGRHEIANILDEVFSRDNWGITDEELTPLVRDNYTAVLLVCDPEKGQPETFYSVKGSLGGALAVNEAGELVWTVNSVASTFFSPATSAYTIGGTCQVFRYTFDRTGSLVRQEDTGETAPYHR